jgi:tetratricopeptide (TPR) repeat protein
LGADDHRSSDAEGAPSGLDRYRTLSELGRGGQGVVWLAEDRALHRRVALKILDRSASSDERARFKREAEAAARVAHPALCPVYDVGEADGTAWIAMRHAEGGSLAARLKKRGGPPKTRKEVEREVELVETLARGLHAAHEAGVLHRDVKPANILLTKEGEPLLADFGMARDLRADSATLTERHHVVGTLPYMAPERLYGGRDVDARADVFALGVTLYELLSGRRPFDGATLSAVAASVENDEVRSLRALNPHVDRGLDAVVRTALAKPLGARYRTAAAFADDLRRARAGEPVAASPPGPFGRLVLRAKRRPLVAALSALAIVALAAALSLGGFLWARRGDLAAQEAFARAEAVDRLVEEGFAEISHGEKSRAAAAFEAARRIDPRDPHLAIGRAILATSAPGGFDAALAIVREAATRDLPRREAYLRAEAELLVGAGRKDEVPPERLRTTPNGDPFAAFVEGVFLMERAHRGETREGSVRDVLVAASTRLREAATFGDSARRLYRFELAHALSHHADPTTCSEAADSLLRLYGDDPVASTWAASLYLRSSPAKAVAVARRGIANGAAGRQIRRTLVLALRGVGDEAAALVEGKAYVERFGADEGDVLGSALRAPVAPPGAADATEEALDAAVALAESRVASAPDDVGARVAYALDLARAGRMEEALRVVDEALAARPDDRDARAVSADLRYRKGDFAAAEADARRAILVSPRDPRPYATLGRVLYKAGRLEEALAAQTRRTALLPESPSAQFDLGRVALDLRRHREAIGAFEAARRLSPDDPQVLCNLGHALRRAGYPSQALPHLKKGHEIGSKRPSWRYRSAEWIAETEADLPFERFVDSAEHAAPDASDAVFEAIENAGALDVATRLLRERGAAAVETRLWEFVARERVAIFEADGLLRPPRAAAAALAAAATLEAATTDASDGTSAKVEAARLRERARDWLESALVERRATFAAAKAPDADPETTREARARRAEILSWFSDPAFASVRDETAAAALSEREASAWRAFFGRAAEALAEAP